jgi:signal transduction histidine kinase
MSQIDATTLLSHAPFPIAVTNGAAHTLAYTNSAFRKLVGAGYTDGNVAITDVLSFSANTLQSLLDRAWTDREVLEDRPVGALAQRGDNWRCTIWPLGDVGGMPRGLVITLHQAAHAPLNSLESPEKPLANDLNQMRFLGNISHELRTPINAIVGYVQLLSEEIHGPVTAAQQGDLERIRVNQEHLLELINELLAFVRSGTPRNNRMMAVPVHEAVTGALRLIENTLSRKSILYEQDPDDADVVAFGDPERIRQILMNLLANAARFTPRGGHIITRCEALDDRVHISVTDNGIGIQQSKLESIFEPFVQVHSGQTNGGLGLGLPISRELARSMQGDITVESQIGKGTRFTLTLPRVPPPDATGSGIRPDPRAERSEARPTRSDPSRP